MEIKRKTIGLALGSGGPRGLAHIGVIQALLNEKINIDYIAGTSAGALIGGMYGVERNLLKIENLAHNFSYKDLLEVFSDPQIGSGIIGGKKAVSFLDDIIGSVNIENMAIPFKAVATDLFTAEAVIIDKGSLSEAIRASGSIPLMFQPVKINDRYLVDGGLSQPVPVETVKKMGADIVIAVNLDHVYFSALKKGEIKPLMSFLSVANTSLSILRCNLSIESAKDADIIVVPDIKYASDIGFNSFINGKDIIQSGLKAMEKMIPELKKLLN
ncbi:MAG: patatin-like phospholipase family protein [Candidatus Parcubacteria bacterium]|nr:patatin-like phospholipase family protein [Candidatus Parcubacteria bacterium]